MTKGVYKILPSKNLATRNNQKRRPEQIQSTVHTTKQIQQPECKKKQNINKFQKNQRVPPQPIKKKRIVKQSKESVAPIKRISITRKKQEPKRSNQKQKAYKSTRTERLNKGMLQRKIEENSEELKQKPYFNYYHDLVYNNDPRKCDNCFEGFSNEENEMLYCEDCNSYIHKACYSLSQDQYDAINKQENEDECNFTFIKCESCTQREKNPVEEIECMICGRDVGIMKCFYYDQRRVVYASQKNQSISEYEYFNNKTPVVMLNDDEIKRNKNIKEVYAHPLCVNTCSCLFIYYFKYLLVWDEEDLKKKTNLGKKQKCSQCHQGGGLLIQCEHKKKAFESCDECFHPFCAAEKKMIYYQQGMRLIHQNSNLKYSKLDDQTYYYIICPSHVQQMFNQKYLAGHFNDKEQIYQQLKLYTRNEQKNFEDWLSQMIKTYESSSQNSKSELKEKSSSSNSKKNVNDSSMNSNISQRTQQEKQPVENINLDQFLYQKKRVDSNSRVNSREDNTTIPAKINNVLDDNTLFHNQSSSSKYHFTDGNQKKDQATNLVKQKTNSSEKQSSSNSYEKNKKTVSVGKTKSEVFSELLDMDDLFNERAARQEKLIKKKMELENQKEEQVQITTETIQKPISQSKRKESYVNSKGLIVEEILTEKQIQFRQDFERKINQQRTLSPDAFGGRFPNICLPELQKVSKSQKSSQNTLKRELGIDLPSPPQKKKKTKEQNFKEFKEGDIDGKTQKKTSEVQIINEDNKINLSNCNKKKDNMRKDEEPIEVEQEEESQTDQNQESNDSEQSFSDCDSGNEEIVEPRRSERVKKVPQALDNKIYKLYEQKKSSSKKKQENGGQLNKESSSSETKQEIYDKQESTTTTHKHKEKNYKNGKENRNKSYKSTKKQNDDSIFYDINSEDQKSTSSQCTSSRQEGNQTLQSKPSKKQKQDIQTSEPDNLRRYLSFDNVCSSEEEEQKRQEKRKSVNSNKSVKKQRNYRNLDKRDDNSIEDNNMVDEDSFQFILDDSASEQQEISDIGYVIDKLNQLNEKNQEMNNKDEEEDEEDNLPIDLPDLYDDDQFESIEQRNISSINGKISNLSQYQSFLKEDSKVKKYSILNDSNYEQYQQGEIARLIRRKQVLEQRIVEKKRLRIDKYRQALHYFNQQIEKKCIRSVSSDCSYQLLQKNIDSQIPSNRLIKYLMLSKQEKSNIIDLQYFPYSTPTKFQIIGFSTTEKVLEKNIENTKLIHNFFTSDK